MDVVNGEENSTSNLEKSTNGGLKLKINTSKSSVSAVNGNGNEYYVNSNHSPVKNGIDGEHHKSSKHRHSDGNKEHRKDKHHSSSKHKSSKDSSKSHSSSNHEKSSSHKHSSHKDHSRDKDKHKHKDKDRSSDKKRDSSGKHREEKHSKSDSRIKEEKHSSRNEHSKIKSSKNREDKVIKTEPNFTEYENHSDKKRPVVKKEIESDDEDDIPLSHRKKVEIKKEPVSPVKRKYADSDSDDEPLSKRAMKTKPAKKRPSEVDSPSMNKKSKIKKEPVSPQKRVKKEKIEKEEPQVWKWWEEEKKDDGVKWKTLEHKGPFFAPPYEPLPSSVKFLYDGKHMVLSETAEEVAGFYARMIEHDYVTKDVFNNNFFKDWRKVMTSKERETITDLMKCNFKQIHSYYVQKSEERKSMSKEEKLAIKKRNEELVEEYGFCLIDGHREKIGNFRIEPPGLFRGRGEHPKMGKLKRRVEPSDIIINCGKASKIPVAPDGKRWKEVRHDNKVTWLVSWNENIQGQTKYIMLNPSSKLKGEKDWQKYETARNLKKHVDKIREDYKADLKSKEMKARQRAVALYFIDKLALRAGNEKDDGESADTVGCCSLRVEHIKLHPELDDKENVVEFDFLGKDSIRYQNSVPVEKRVFKNLQIFLENKQDGDDLFDRLNTTILNKYLNDLMDGLTAKVFRTFNASKTLQEQLDELTQEGTSIPEKILSYNRANRAVAILCNHQRAVPKTFGKQMENLQKKLDDKKDAIKAAKKDVKSLKQSVKNGGASKDRVLLEKKKKTLERLEEQLVKLEVQATDKEENKQIALGTSKLNYLDPRISVAWSKKWDVPIEKIYNKTQRDKFRWAIEMAGPDFKF